MMKILSMRNIPAVVLLMISAFLACSAEEILNDDIPLAALIDSLSIDTGGIYLHIDKSDYVLSVMADTVIVKQYPVVLGGNPVDDKRMQGDQCTPEGRFRVLSKYPHRSWEKFIWIDYPNNESRIKFNEAKARGDIPPDARIGGEIGIHGVPGGADEVISLGINWTLGCISLKNDDINEIYPYIDKGSVVIIQY